MSRSESRIQNNRLRRKKELKKNIKLSIITLVFVASLSFAVGGFWTNAKSSSESVEFKYYKSVVVGQGDTLWSIANENMNDHYKKGVAVLINEIMQMNGLSDDKITAGSYLIVPYYSDEFVS